jgi:hypothetical protein
MSSGSPSSLLEARSNAPSAPKPFSSRLLKPFALLAIALAGTALLSAQTTVTFTQTPYNSGDYSSDMIVSGDFNNDGILDIVTVNPTTLSFYKGIGKGVYADAVTQTIPNNYGGGGGIFAADLNGDGKLDIAFSYGYNGTGGNEVLIYFGNGKGGFTAGTPITTPEPALSMAWADFNGDHKPDIAVSNQLTNQTWIYLGKGDGTFTLSDTLDYGGNTIVAGDFNADGKQDLAFAGGSGNTTVGVYLGNGNGTFQAPVLASLSDVSSLAVGDFYNTRIQTVAALNSTESGYYIHTLRYDDGVLYVENQNFYGDPTAAGPQFLAAGDLNGDFLFDIFLTGGSYNGGGVTAYMIGNGNGTFQSPQTAPNNGAGIAYVSPFIRDLNRDSRHDVGTAWQTEGEGGAEILLNTSATTNCNPPAANKLSAVICAPSPGQIVSPTYTFKGAGNTFNGVVKRMELWIDGKKIGQNLEDQLKVTTTLTKGQHTASFVVIDTFDEYTSTSVTFSAN